MSNFLDKLNTLVKASVNNLIDEAGSKVPKLPSARLGSNIDGEIAALRKQIDAALNEQDEIQGRIDDLQRQIDQYDQQIDQALQSNDDANARYLSVQMQQAQRRQSMLMADLEAHKRSTSDFIQRVSTLESMVADARREQEEKRVQAPVDSPVGSQSSESPQGAPLADMLRDARERVQQMISGNAAPASGATTTPPSDQPVVKIKITNEDAPSKPVDSPAISVAPTASQPPQPAPIKIPINADPTPDASQNTTKSDDAEIEADLVKRRNRLSGPEKPQGS